MLIRPPFGRTGSKYYLLKHILPELPFHSIYVEPFVGGGAVFFNKEPAEINILNDLDLGVIQRLNNLKHASANLKDYPQDLITLEKTKDFWLNHSNTIENRVIFDKISTCCGYSGKRVKRVSDIYTRLQSKAFYPHLREIKDILDMATLFSKDYEIIVKKYDSLDTFFFFDPPYENTNTQFEYAQSKDFDFIRLEKVIRKIRGRFLLTINDSPYIRELFHGFQMKSVIAKAGFKTARGTLQTSRNELIITNY